MASGQRECETLSYTRRYTVERSPFRAAVFDIFGAKLRGWAEAKSKDTAAAVVIGASGLREGGHARVVSIENRERSRTCRAFDEFCA